MKHYKRKSLAPKTEPNKSSFSGISEFVTNAVEHIRMRNESPNAITGIPSCFPTLDYFTSGLQRGNLIVVAGRPCMGKRSFVRNIAMHLALDNQLPVAILDNDTGGKTQSLRMLASLAEIDYHSLSKGQIGDDEFIRLESAANTLKKAPIFYSSFTPMSVQELGVHLRSISQSKGVLGLVVVDCLPEVKHLTDKSQLASSMQIAKISRDLKSLAEELNVPIIVLSPIDRDLEERDNKYPRIGDLPGMGAIANAADLVLFLYRDEVYDPESEKLGLAEIIISRNRGGSIGGFQLKYDGLHQRFFELQ